MKGKKYPPFEWNYLRKLWHFLGSILMVGIFYLWKDWGEGSILHRIALIAFVWFLAALLLVIDIIRLYSAKNNQSFQNLPIYGRMMRSIEKDHLNATTYYVLASAILTTAYVGAWCRASTLVMALLVTGVADPIAAWARNRIQRWRPGQEQFYGVWAFATASILVMGVMNRILHAGLSLLCIFLVAVIVALVEAYSRNWMQRLQPLTRRLQRSLTHPGTRWLIQVYPDDNFVVPLLVAVLLGLLRNVL
ncbi:MAG: hypothetical protein WCX86_01870 [Candidatus Hydrogenedentales bacterium]|jgi:dolichol kinase